MKVSIREKELSDGRKSLYLDIYNPKSRPKRKKEFLKLYLFGNPRNQKEREANRKTSLLAESIRSKRLLELQHNQFGFSHLNQEANTNFIEYFSEQAEKRKESTGNYGNWDSVLKHLIRHSGKDFSTAEINTAWLEDFKDYLKNRARTKSDRPLSQNSCFSYFNKMKACLKQALKDNLIASNPGAVVSGFKQGETQREFLTLEELKALAQTDCEMPIVKTAFLFSALTGLRWSDIQKLTWKEIQHSDSQGWYIRFKQKKTKGIETLPVSEQARNLLAQEVSRLLETFLKKDVNSDLPDVIFVDQVATLTGYKKSTIYSKVSRFELPVLSRRKPLTFSRKSILQWLKDGKPNLIDQQTNHYLKVHKRAS